MKMKNLQITLSIKIDDALISSEEIKYVCSTENPRGIEGFILNKTALFLAPFDEERKALYITDRKVIMKHSIANALNTHHSSQELDQSK